MFLRNAWYVAATSKQLAERPIVARMLLNQRIVVFRTERGDVAALRDACIHRQAPLSLGRVVGDTIQCGYHGARFDRSGRCVEIPGQSSIPPKARVQCFPVAERFGFIWLWMGDPSRAVDGTFPDSFAVSDDPQYRGGDNFAESIKANYRLLNDNLFDVTHAEFVHPSTFGGKEIFYYRNAKPGPHLLDRGMTYELKERSAHFRIHVASLGDEGAPLWRRMMAQARNIESWPDPVNLTMEMNWWAPCYTSFSVILRPVGATPEDMLVRSHKLHAAVPETETTTNYFYRTLVSYGDDVLIAKWLDQAHSIYLEDLKFLEGQQAAVGSRDVLDVEHVSFHGDQLQLAGRRILHNLIKAEEPLRMAV